ncbi:MAG TPA: GMC family oxidoreductase [Chromatiaceae bacterium]|nr:GMC family oxidoreductase [Chromatiaceae bacterium]
MNHDYDVIVIGSGAGGSPVALTLARAGHSVLVLERGPWYGTDDFCKDELACCLRDAYKPDRREEPHIIELEDDDGGWKSQSTEQGRWNLWNGNCVGGASNFRSGYFHRLKPVDFRLLSEFGPIEGANLADWPINYSDLEPYYTRVEREVGVSGKVHQHPHAEPRSTREFPYPPLQEHAVAGMLDEAGKKLGFHPFPTPRAILSRPEKGRNSCAYNGGYCGSTGCSTGAKGSARVALLEKAVATGHCEVRPHSLVKRIITNAGGKIAGVEYFDQSGKLRQVDAGIYVVACQAIETAKLLLRSTGPKFPQGLANSSGLVGKNLLFAGGGAGSGNLPYAKFDKDKAQELAQTGFFVNRALQDWYVIDDKAFGPRQKGGTIDFVHVHPSPALRASRHLDGDRGLVWGKPLKRNLEHLFRDAVPLKVEAFCDWLPIDDSFVALDQSKKDKWGMPLARVRAGFHVQNLKVGWYLAAKGAEMLKAIGAEDVISFASGAPPTNLLAGTCRFGTDPTRSVLDKNCRAHDVDNLYVTDGSFMPTGGSVPYTWTIYANAFRVADHLLQRLPNKLTERT